MLISLGFNGLPSRPVERSDFERGTERGTLLKREFLETSKPLSGGGV